LLKKRFLNDFDETLTSLEFDEELQKRIRTTNYLDRYFKEIKRRIRPMSSFTDPQSCERIIYALVDTLNRKNTGTSLNEENEFTQNS